MIPRPEQRRPMRAFITAHALEHRAAVADDVRKDVNLRVVPRNQPAIVPDLLGSYQHVEIIAAEAVAKGRVNGRDQLTESTSAGIETPCSPRRLADRFQAFSRRRVRSTLAGR